jgi:regulator of protease activity HflC (stomatin/prohibitin superfamily)
MAEIRNFVLVRHLRAEPSSHVLAYKNGRLAGRGRGLAFWFLPMSTAVAEVPVDDREQAFLFHGRSADFQDVTAQGVLTYRVIEPERLADRIDFSLDLKTGRHVERPLDTIASFLGQIAQQHAWTYVATTPVKKLLSEGHAVVRRRIEEGFATEAALPDLGIEVVSVRVSSIAPTPDLERALEAPAREDIQQSADEAAFARRAQAVENERAIQENELKNRIELARREETLIAQEGQNEKRRVVEQAEAGRIAAEAEAARLVTAAEASARRQRIEGDARAAVIEAVEGVRTTMEANRMEIFRDVAPQVLLALAAQELAKKLGKIDHLNVSPELLGPMLANLVSAGTRRLEG